MADAPTRSAASPAPVLWIGGYTTRGEGRGPGLRALDAEAARAGRTEVLAEVPLAEPSYVVPHPTLPRSVVCVHETEHSAVSVVTLGPGDQPEVSTTPTGGWGACHVAVTQDGRFAVVAHYVSGSVAVIDLESGRRTATVALAGSPGPVADRQDAPHAHHVLLAPRFEDGGWLVLVCDLGTDAVHRFRLGTDGTLTEADAPVRLPAGTGPRHAALVAGRLLVVCELSSELWLGAPTDDGARTWHESARIPTTARPTPDGLAAALRLLPDAGAGTRVLVSTRGPDSFTVVDVSPADDDGPPLVARAEHAAGGRWPRDVLVDGELVWVACERGDVVTAVRWADGTEVARLASGTPTGLALT